MENEFRFLEYEGVQIATFIEGHDEGEHVEYLPHNVLFYVQQGQLNIRYRHKLYSITKSNFALVRKFTELTYFKTWDDDEGYALVNAMILQDDFIQQAIKELGQKVPNSEFKQPVIHLEKNAILKGLHQSLMLYITENQTPDKHLIYLKTKEALLGIIKSNPDYLALFHEFSKPVKVNLKEFMNHNSISILPLHELAKLSGRSLSTFNREFKKLFRTSPHNWILKNRLAKAKELLATTNKKPSEIYLELGFKDLGHFSRVFKKEFDMPPSHIYKNKF